MNLHKEILRLAGPSILANITVPLVGMVDIAVAGHLGDGSSAALIGGVSVGAMIFNLLYWNFGFLRVGTGGLTAQAYGASADSADREAATGPILRRALRIAIGSGLALIVLQEVLLWLVLLLVPCTADVRELATRYYHIRIWAAPATLSLFAFKGWFIGLQDAVRPMTADLLVNGLNIVLSLALGFGPTGFAGIALATAVAQWAGFLYCLLAARRRYHFSVTLKHLKISKMQDSSQPNPLTCFQKNTDNQVVKRQGYHSFVQLNLNLFLRSLGMMAVYVGFTALAAGLGDTLLAVSAILMNLLMVFSYFSDGFAYAGEALTGRFIGAGDAEGVRCTIRQTFLWSGALALLFILVYAVGSGPIFRLMTSDEAVMQAGMAYVPWLLMMPVVGCAAFTWDGIFIGATASKDLRNSTLLCAAGFYAVWFAGIALLPGQAPETALHLLMGAYFTHLAIRALYLTLRRGSLIRALPV